MTEVAEWGRGLTGPFMKSLNLPGDTPVKCRTAWPYDSYRIWDGGIVYRLPADHFVYTVLDYNDEHGTNFVPWAGGDDAPDDWDGGDVLLREGTIGDGLDWRHGLRGDIIGYTRKEPATNDDVQLAKHMVDTLGEYVRVKKMTAKEWDALVAGRAVSWARELGIIAETPVERFKRENPGLSADELLAKALENNK